MFWDFSTKTIKERPWPDVGNCSSAIRWLNRYYCFRGNKFLRFDPIKGEVNSTYPRDVRDYFMSCPNRGEKAPALGPLETCPPSLSLQTPYTPAPTLTYGMIPWPLPQPHFHAGSSQLSSYGEDLHPQYPPAVSSTSDLILTSCLHVFSLAYFSPKAMHIGMQPSMWISAVAHI